MKHTLLFLFLLFFSPVFSQNKNLSIGFTENKGQIIDQKGRPNTSVKFLLNTGGLNVQLRKNGFSYDVYEVKKTPVREKVNSREQNSHFILNQEEKPEFDHTYTFHRIDIDFENSNSNVTLLPEQKSTDFENYYNIPDKPNGIIGVYTYKQVTYKNIYSNIDVVFTIPNDPKKPVEYNFVVHPKGKIADIKLKFSGVETDLVDHKILMNVRFGKMEETLPASWVEAGNSKKEIEVRYTKIKKNIYGFETEDPICNKRLIIDPVPIRLWGTYYGGEDFDYTTALFAKDNFVYMAGITYSKNNIASAGSSQTTYSPGKDSDTFFTKLNSDGTRAWGTYYGGNNADEILKIKASNKGNIFIVGRSLSPINISTPNTYQPNKSGFFDGFIAKFDSDGVRYWGTYYGGLINDAINSISIDNNENFYVCGETDSKENIASVGSHQDSPGNISDNTQDGFIAKFDFNGIKQWSSYYGGNRADSCFDCELNSNGDIIIVGSSRSSNNISTVNSYQELNLSDDGFLVRFNSMGNRVWGTYFGGNNDDYFFNIGIDENDNIYTFGRTNSTSNISSTGVFQLNYIQNAITNSSGCIFKFDPNGYKIWGSYFFPETLGGSVSKQGSIYFTGRVENGFLSTPNSYQEDVNSGLDSYLVKFNTNGNREWATYVGGESADNALVTAVDHSDYIYLGGTTISKTKIATPGTHQTILHSNTNSYTLNTGDAFVMKFKDCESNILVTSNSPICIGSKLELKASGGTNYLWTGPNGFTSTDQNPTITNASLTNSGDYSCLISGVGNCSDETKKITVAIGDIEPPVPNIANLPIISGDCNTIASVVPTATDKCAGQIIGTTANLLSYTLPGTYTIVWNYNDGNGNTATQDQTVIITSQPLPTTNSPQNFCIQENATLVNIQITGQNIKWYNSTTSETVLPSTTLLENGKIYFASQTINGCESERIPVTVNIESIALPTGNPNQFFCTGQNATISNIAITGNSIKWYDSITNGSLITETTAIENGKTYYASQTINNCDGPRFGVTTTIVNTPVAPTGNSNQEYCINQNATLSNILISGQNIKWYDTNFSTTTLPITTLLESNRIYYASQTVGCESDRTPISIQIHNIVLPTGNNNQQFCIDEIATIENLNITGSNLIWYDASVNGNILPETTLLENKIYYVTQTLYNCESEPYAITVKIQETQNPIITSPQIFCIQKNAKLSDIEISGQNIKWFESESSTVNLSESTLLENGITYYAQEIMNNCKSNRVPITISILEDTVGNCINLIDELPFPKFFTPNNDGYNDTWTIDFAYLAPGSSIRIFDRYGKFIKELTPNTSWDGNYLGRFEPASDYWFSATRKDGTEFRSHFSLKR